MRSIRAKVRLSFAFVSVIVCNWCSNVDLDSRQTCLRAFIIIGFDIQPNERANLNRTKYAIVAYGQQVALPAKRHTHFLRKTACCQWAVIWAIA